MIRLLIADKCPIVSEGIEHALDENDTVTIIGQVTTFSEIDDWCRQHQPDVLVLSLNILPDPMIEAIGSVQAHYPVIKLLIYTEECDNLCLQSLLDAGVEGCMLKWESVDVLIAAIHVIANGGTYFSRPALEELVQATPVVAVTGEAAPNPLTERESEVVVLVASGMSNQQIAEFLSITTRTVAFHTTNIYNKLGGLTRFETIVWAWENGLVNDCTL